MNIITDADVCSIGRRDGRTIDASLAERRRSIDPDLIAGGRRRRAQFGADRLSYRC